MPNARKAAEIRELHKRSHGLDENDDRWYDTRFKPDGEWDVNTDIWLTWRETYGAKCWLLGYLIGILSMALIFRWW